MAIRLIVDVEEDLSLFLARETNVSPISTRSWTLFAASANDSRIRMFGKEGGSVEKRAEAVALAISHSLNERRVASGEASKEWSSKPDIEPVSA